MLADAARCSSARVIEQDTSRHVALRRMFLRELVGLKVIRMVPCSTQKMVADALTKSLPEPALRCHRDEMLGKAKAPYCAYLLHAIKHCMISGGQSCR